LKISGLFLASIIIIVSFVYSMNMQPVVTGESVNFIPKYSDLKTFSSYNEFTRFLKETSQTSYYWPSSGMLTSGMRLGIDSESIDADFSNFDL